MPTSFRADQVGSFLRPPELKDAHAAHREGRLSQQQLRELEDRAILDILQLQQQVGIDVFSDGEFRRAAWASDFADSVDGYVPGLPAVTVFNSASGNMPGLRGAAGGRVIGQKLTQKRRLTEGETAFM